MRLLNPIFCHACFSILFLDYSKLLAKGCPAHVQPGAEPAVKSVEESQSNKDFRDLSMHGSVDRMKEIVANVDDVHAKEMHSERTAMRKFFIVVLLELFSS